MFSAATAEPVAIPASAMRAPEIAMDRMARGNRPAFARPPKAPKVPPKRTRPPPVIPKAITEENCYREPQGVVAMIQQQEYASRAADGAKEKGAYYTPDSVVRCLLSWAVRSPGDRLLDPCNFSLEKSYSSSRLKCPHDRSKWIAIIRRSLSRPPVRPRFWQAANGSTQRFIAKRDNTTPANLSNWIRRNGIRNPRACNLMAESVLMLGYGQPR